MTGLEDVLSNPYDNVYWFARMLINTDKYGGIGTKSSKMLEIASCIKTVVTSMRGEREDDLIPILVGATKKTLLKDKKEGSKIHYFTEQLWIELEKRLITVKDFEVLALTCELIMVPINESLSRVPNNDRIFVESFAQALFEAKGEAGLATIINLWDDLGAAGCLTAERMEVVREFKNLKHLLDRFFDKEDDKCIVLSAFCQEFERRLGQKRKGRAGGSLEGVTSFILNYFGIKTTHEPEHFTTGMEIDKWVKLKDGWIIGISCKRTFRERWKQAYTTDINMLNRHKIRELWHVITYDKDLSDDKITEMGSHRAILYLPPDSPRYQNAVKHPGMKDYVRCITDFIKDIKSLT